MHKTHCEVSRAPLSHFKANALSIEHLEIFNAKIDMEFVETISQMKQLKGLVLRGVNDLSDEHLICLAMGLGSQLEILRLEDSSTAKYLTTSGLKTMLTFATKLSVLKVQLETIKIDVKDYNAMRNIQWNFVNSKPSRNQRPPQIIKISNYRKCLNFVFKKRH